MLPVLRSACPGAGDSGRSRQSSAEPDTDRPGNSVRRQGGARAAQAVRLHGLRPGQCLLRRRQPGAHLGTLHHRGEPVRPTARPAAMAARRGEQPLPARRPRLLRSQRTRSPGLVPARSAGRRRRHPGQQAERKQRHDQSRQYGGGWRLRLAQQLCRHRHSVRSLEARQERHAVQDGDGGLRLPRRYARRLQQHHGQYRRRQPDRVRRPLAPRHLVRVSRGPGLSRERDLVARAEPIR